MSARYLPRGWKTTTLGEVVVLINGDRGKNYPSQADYVEDGVPFINAGHLLNGAIGSTSMNYISEDRFALLSSGKVQCGDLLYCLRGSLGKTAIVQSINRGAIASSLVIIRPSSDITSKYLYYFLTSSLGAERIRKFDNGTAQPNLSASSVSKYTLPLPPLPEQRRITAILDKADAIRRKRKKAIEMTEELLEATFLDMFGDPVTNPKGWKVRPLKQLITGLRGGSPLKPFDFFDEGFPVFHKGAIKPFGRIQFDAKKRLCTSSDFAAKYSRAIIDSTFTVVTLRDLVPSGPSIGLMAQTKSCESPEYILAQGVYGFKPAADLIVPEYLVWMSNTTSYRRSLKRIWVGSTQIHIRTPVFFDMEVPVPPMPKQLEFQSLVNKLVVCELSLASSARAQDELFHSLTQRAFLGML